MQDLSLDLLQQEIEYSSSNRDFQGAFEAFQIVSDWLAESGLKSDNPEKYSKYLEYLNKLKFLSLNYFDSLSDYESLLKSSFPLIFEIPNFDLWEKLEIYLISVSNPKDRDGIKEKLKAALSHCGANLFDYGRYKNKDVIFKVSDWIKDFIVNLGLDNFDSVKKTEYLMNGNYIKQLDKDDQSRVQYLLEIYEKLGLSSQTKEGYENSVFMDIDGKKVVFNRGEVEEIKPLSLKYSNSYSPINNDVLSDERPTSSMKSETSPTLEQALAEPETPATKIKIPRTTELEEILDSYSPASLEYKAISQEIMRLKKTEARKNAKR